MTEKMNKAQRLAVAAAVAPNLRRGVGASRRVKTYDQSAVEPSTPTADIEVKREMSLQDATLGILRHLEVEIAVQDDVRPKTVICKNCGKTVEVKKEGAIPTVCRSGCSRRCGTCDTHVSARSARNAARNRTVPRCRACGQRKAQSTNAKKTPDERSEAARKRAAKITPQRRSEIARKAAAAIAAASRRACARLTPQQRSNRVAKAQLARALISPEKRSEAVRKGHVTRAVLRGDDPAWQAKAVALRANGLTIRAIADELGKSYGGVWKAIKRASAP